MPEQLSGITTAYIIVIFTGGGGGGGGGGCGRRRVCTVHLDRPLARLALLNIFFANR